MSGEMLLNSWCNSCGPLTVQCWVIQTDAYHCSIPRGEIWTAISIQEWPCFLHPPSSPASHKHIAAGTHTWPVSLNTSNTWISSGLNQYCEPILLLHSERYLQCQIPNVEEVLVWTLSDNWINLNVKQIYKVLGTEHTKNLPPIVWETEFKTFIIRYQKCDQKHKNGGNV